MIELFLNFLNEKSIPYKVVNGYEEILEPVNVDSDFDILFRKKDFRRIDALVKRFSESNGFQMVQMYHQGRYAKNFFVYDTTAHTVLNLDLYGELSRQGIKILNEEEVFGSHASYGQIPILRPDQEFIQYLVKRMDKESISKTVFQKLKNLFDASPEACGDFIARFFKNTANEILVLFKSSNHDLLVKNNSLFKEDFKKNTKTAMEPLVFKSFRIAKRIYYPTGLTIAFLGPDGSGKSTIIDLISKRILPFRRTDYFHLKPLPQDKNKVNQMVTDPHGSEPYSPIKSYVKLLYFLYQYNWGWFKNVALLKRKSSLIIFDRYFDDILVDYKRYRYGSNNTVANFFKYFIPRPELYFILTAESDIIHSRKQEVVPEELKRQITGYRSLVDGKRYIDINVSKEPKFIVDEIFGILMKTMNERY